MHQTLGEHVTAYPTIPKSAHYSPVDNTVHMGAAAVVAQWNEALGKWCRKLVFLIKLGTILSKYKTLQRENPFMLAYNVGVNLNPLFK